MAISVVPAPSPQPALANLQSRPKIILVNNKAVAALVHINDFNQKFTAPELNMLPSTAVTPTLKRQAKQARNLKKKDLINL
jgi:hypothetical protein